jgi:SAM-dependent methyltransferase
MLPEISRNIKADQNYHKFSKILLQKTNNPTVLVIGGGILGKGMESLLKTDITLVDSDVSFAPRTQIILDAHDIPFEDETFDGVIAQAVLEHVIDPHRCTEEINRVLKKDGLIYAEIPFMQQVHGREYDFTRFTHTGMRRLLRKFTEISSGACYGPGVALAWSIRNFFLSFTTNKIQRSSVNLFCRLTLFWIKYFDYYLIDKPGALDSASCYYFMGKKSNLIVSDQEIVKRYQGAGQKFWL